MDIITLIDRWSLIAPQRIAHLSGEQALTYQDLVNSSNLLADHIASLLPDDHAPVAVIGHKENEMLIGFLGAVKAGHPYIPIDTSLPPQRIKVILESSKAALSLTPGEIRSILSKKQPFVSPSSPQNIHSEDPWYIIFTSGSTGEPKGVVITAGCLESFINWMLSEQKLNEQKEIFLNQAPFSFDLSVMDLYLSLVSGGTLYSISKDEIADPSQMYRSLFSSAVTVWVSTPSFAQMCLVEPTFSADNLPDLRKFLFCGETLAPEVACSLLLRFPQAEVWNTYGPTEATCATTSVQVNQTLLNQYTPLPVGFPKFDSRVWVVDQDGNPTPENERGEIIIAGPNVSPGYLGRPDLTQRSFFMLDNQCAYRTGDWGHYQDKLLFFDGRIDSQVKLHGYRIELGDVEANLLSLPMIQDAVVLAALKKGLPDYLAAFIILREQLAKNEYETTRILKRELGQRLPAYMVPKKFFFLKQFPMTSNGKADRRKLAESLT